MRQKVVAASLLAAALFGWEIQPAAQNTRAEKSQDQNAQASASPGILSGATADQCERMTDMIEQMTTYQRQMAVTMNKLMENVTDLQKEKDMAEQRSKLAEQSGLLDVMKIYMVQQSSVTQSMTEQLRRNCPVPENAEKPAPN